MTMTITGVVFGSGVAKLLRSFRFAGRLGLSCMEVRAICLGSGFRGLGFRGRFEEDLGPMLGLILTLNPLGCLAYSILWCFGNDFDDYMD